MKSNSIVRTIAEVGIFAAIGFVLDEIQGVLSFSFTAGGSIGIAMIAVLIIAYRRGILPAIATGLIMGLLDISTKAYIIHPAQCLLDYIFPYALVGVAGVFKYFFDKTDNKNTKIIWLITGAGIGGLLKFLSHFLAGVIFWNDPADFQWGLNSLSAAGFSFIYNFAYVGPSIVLCSLLLVILFLKAPKVLMTEGNVVTYVISEEKKQKASSITVSSLLIGVGLFLFVFFLVKYIVSLENYSSPEEIYYTFDRNCMVFFISGIAFALLGLNALLKSIKKIFKYSVLALDYGILIILFSIVGLARIIEMYTDEKYPINNLYWVWFVVSLVVGTGLIILFFLNKKKTSKE